jgi:hypothetical protein
MRTQLFLAHSHSFVAIVCVFLLLRKRKRKADNVLSEYNVKMESKLIIPVFPESMFSACLDLCDPLHSFDRSLHQFAVVSNRHVSSFLEIDCGVLNFERTDFFFRQLVWPWRGMTINNLRSSFLYQRLSGKLSSIGPSVDFVSSWVTEKKKIEMRLTLKLCVGWSEGQTWSSYDIYSRTTVWEKVIRRSENDQLMRRFSTYFDVQNRKTFASFRTKADPGCLCGQQTCSGDPRRKRIVSPCPG